MPFAPGRKMLLALLLASCALPGILKLNGSASPPLETVKAISAPSEPLPQEQTSAKVAKFSFILYGDTRGGQDGFALQSDHARVVDEILSEIKTLRTTKFPARFILQTGDAVVRGEDAHEWNAALFP